MSIVRDTTGVGWSYRGGGYIPPQRALDRKLHPSPAGTTAMAPTVDEYRDEIRLAVGRYERVESTAFTKESLAAICAAVDREPSEGRLPPKAEMRAAIRDAVEGLESTPDGGDRPFRKAELETLAAALTGEE